MKRLLILAAVVALPMGAEAQTCSAWSVCPSVPDFAVTTAAAFPPSTYGMAITVNDPAEIILVRDNSPADESSYWARFYFNPNNFPLVDGNRQRVFMFHDASNTRLVAIIFRQVAGNYSFLARVWDGASMLNMPGGVITDDWHYLTMHWVKATTPSATDGQFVLYVDGTQVGSNTTLATGNSTGVDYARMGIFDPIQYNGTTGTYYYDEVEERRQTNPGTYVP